MRSPFSAVLALGILLAGCTTLAPSAEPQAVAWTQFGPGDDPDLVARVLIDDSGRCPSITVDGVTATMRERQDVRSAYFGRMCEERRSLAQSMRVRIAYGDRVLLDQTVTRDPKTVAVVGDTGCRVTSFYDQVCGDPAKWPFPQVAESIAAKAPSMILHLGDYYYRETPCKGSSLDCAKAPYGDRLETWRAEFFGPARNLIAKAPWVFVRGNHEDCLHGGYGWTYYFGDSRKACELVYDESIVRLAGLTLVNVDSAHADDKYAIATVNDKWQSIADSIVPKLAGTSGTIVLMTHDAPYVACLKTCDRTDVADVGGIRLIAERLRATGRPVVMLAGHVHTFQTFDGRGGITQVIVGNSGAGLDPYPQVAVPPVLTDVTFPDARRTGDKWRTIVDRGTIPARAQMWGRFGFGILTPATLGLEVYDLAGQWQFGCDLAGETLPRCR